MYESTRRTLCRVAFLALCVAPTVAVLAWAAHVRSPGRIDEAERELAAAFELAVSIDDVSYPRPGVTIYEGVRLSDAETRRVVAEIDDVEVTKLAEGVALVAPRADVDAAQLDRLWRVIDRFLRVQRAADRPPLRLSIERLTLHGEGSDAATLGQVGGQLNAGDDASRAGLRFSLADAASGEPVQVALQRTHGADPSVVRLELRTGSAPLPLSALQSVFPSLRHLGDRATFAGQLWLTHRSDGEVSGDVTGRLAHVDLDALVGRRFPHKLSGEAEITLQKLAFADGRATRMVGRVEAGPGIVGRSLLTAAADALAMRAANRNDDGAADPLAYERLGFTFDVDGQRATLMGACPATASDARTSAAANCVVRDRFGPLLLEAERQPQATLGIVRVLVHDSQWRVPATRETDALMRYRPIPAAAPMADAGESPRATLRDVDRE
jgi:hypothetical protein